MIVSCIDQQQVNVMARKIEVCEAEASRYRQKVYELLDIMKLTYDRAKIVSPSTAKMLGERLHEFNVSFHEKAAPSISSMKKLNSGDVCVPEIENCFFIALLDDNDGTKTVIGDPKGYSTIRKASTAASVFSRGYKLKKFGIHVNAVSLEELYKIPYDFA